MFRIETFSKLLCNFFLFIKIPKPSEMVCFCVSIVITVKMLCYLETVPLAGRLGLPAPVQPALQFWCCTRSGQGVVNDGRILPQHPCCVPVGLKALYEGLHGYFDHVLATCTLKKKKNKKRVL